MTKAQDLSAKLTCKSEQAVKSKGQGLAAWATDQLVELGKLRSYLAPDEDTSKDDFKEDFVPAVKAWVTTTQEFVSKAKAKVKSHQALL